MTTKNISSRIVSHTRESNEKSEAKTDVISSVSPMEKISSLTPNPLGVIKLAYPINQAKIEKTITRKNASFADEKIP